MIQLTVVPKVLAFDIEGLTTIEMGLYLTDDKGNVYRDLGKHIIKTHNDGDALAGALNLADMGLLAKECVLADKRMLALAKRAAAPATKKRRK